MQNSALLLLNRNAASAKSNFGSILYTVFFRFWIGAHLGHHCLEQLLKDKQRHFAALGHSRIVHLQAIVPLKSLLFSFLCFSSTKSTKQTPFSTSMTMKRLPESFKCCCRRSERFTGALNNLLFHNRRPLKDVATTVLSCFQSSV